MPLLQRHKDIIERVRERGYASIEELAQSLAVTPQTIRRDLSQLAERNLLRRYHGGAAHDSSIENTAYSMRARQWHDEKQRIAQAVAAQVPDHASLFITIGTTTEAIARALLNHSGLRVITYNMHVAAILAGKADFEVLLTGGKVRADGCLLDFDFHESRATLAIMENARKVFLAADSSKFGRNAMVRLCSITQVHQLFTDKPPAAALSQLLSNHKVELTIA
ncbi:MAG: DeoR family transcriptional regulator [Pseudomonadaceae bacterium]